jgi:hypothetical protein
MEPCSGHGCVWAIITRDVLLIADAFRSSYSFSLQRRRVDSTEEQAKSRIGLQCYEVRDATRYSTIVVVATVRIS